MNCHWNCNEPRFYGNACRVHAAKILTESCDALEFLRMLEVIPCTPQGAAELLAGSAETGGEKAAPADNDEKLREIVWNAQTAELIRQGKAGHNVDCVDGYDLCDAIVNALAYSPRSPQNQTVSSGVEGAHEGTTADKSESREPEKLNNAHKLIVEIERETDGRWLADVPSVPGVMAYGSTRADAAMNALILLDNVALAESSLSSPPPQFWKWYGMLSLLYHRAGITTWGSLGMATEQECHEVIGEFERFCKEQPTFRHSPSPVWSGAESAHSGKLNTADKSGLLPTQLPKEK